MRAPAFTWARTALLALVKDNPEKENSKQQNEKVETERGQA